MPFDIKKFENIKPDDCRLDRQVNRLEGQNYATQNIVQTITTSIQHIGNGVRAFVVFGEPQSGKTEMMICLTAALLDSGKQVIIVLVNDNLTLLKQNLVRFKNSGIDPDPKSFSEILDPNIHLANKKWVIFCTKNSSNLQKLIEKVRAIKGKVIIDDEADYATPNSRVNQGEKTKINDLVGQLYDADGTYIGVTATPARLDLNNTYQNANDKWVVFEPHSEYTGQDYFFPSDPSNGLQYRLKILPDDHDDKKSIREALFNFLITVAYRNTTTKEENYSFLVHTSGKKQDHADDSKNVLEIIDVLSDKNNPAYAAYLEELWNLIVARYPDESNADKIMRYILTNISRTSVTVINSDKDSQTWDAATNPQIPFTIAIGGNIISRGITFKNLLTMYFTRTVKGKVQQDTYIQRARMFGTRKSYLKDFELYVPNSLFQVWHRCFILHRLSLQSIRAGHAPVWYEGEGVSVVSTNSIDKTTVNVNSGEMGFEIFDYTTEVETTISSAYAGSITRFEALEKLANPTGSSKLPKFLLEYVKTTSPEGEDSVAIHKTTSIDNWTDTNQEQIERPRGFIGTGEMEESKFPKAVHHFKIMKNAAGKARLFYKYNAGSLRILRNMREGTATGIQEGGNNQPTA